MQKVLYRLTLILFLVVAFEHYALACPPSGPPTYTPQNQWLGTIDSDWNNAGNWQSGAPANNDNVLIDAGAYANPPVISTTSSFTIGDIGLQGGAVLTINTNTTANAIENLSNANSSVIVSGTSILGITNDIILRDASALSISGAGNITTANVRYYETNASFTNNITGLLTVNSDIVVDLGIVVGIPILPQNGNSIINNDDISFVDIDPNNGNFTVNNNSTFNMNGTFTNIDAGSAFNNLNGASWNYAGASFDPDVQLFCNNGTNTFNYNAAGIQDIITPQDAYSNLSTSGSGIKTLQGNLQVNGNLTIDAATAIDVSVNNYNINLTGNWVINSSLGDPFIEQGGSIIFDGISSQVVSGTTSANLSLFNLTLLNTSTGLVLSLPVDVSGTATFTDGIVTTDATNILNFTAGSAVSGGSNASFVDGPVSKVGATDFVFPTGDGSKWARIGISNLSGSETFTATYNLSVYPDVTVSGLNHVSGYEHWILDRLGTATAAVTLYWEDGSPTGSDITDIATGDLVVARYDGADWVSEGQGTITGTTTTGSIQTPANVATFSPFTLGSLNGVNPLPIELVSFTGKQENTFVKLNWETASELKNDFFTLRRSFDGAEFTTIGTIKGSGNSDRALEYSFNDYPAKSGIVYYQLIQTDFDGTSETFDMISVRYESKSDLIQVYPNPVSGNELTILFPNETKGNVTVNIYGISGETIYQKKFIDPGNSLILNLENSRAKGIYFMKILTETEGFTTKLYLQ